MYLRLVFSNPRARDRNTPWSTLSSIETDPAWSMTWHSDDILRTSPASRIGTAIEPTMPTPSVETSFRASRRASYIAHPAGSWPPMDMTTTSIGPRLRSSCPRLTKNWKACSISMVSITKSRRASKSALVEVIPETTSFWTKLSSCPLTLAEWCFMPREIITNVRGNSLDSTTALSVVSVTLDRAWNYKQKELLVKESAATRQLKVWLGAIGIACRVRDPYSLWVTRKDGEEVVVYLGPGARPEGSIPVSAAVVTGRSLKESLRVFSALQEVLGYEPRVPVDRGPIPEHKLENGACFEFSAMRHTALRRVPNPTAKQLLRYDLVINRAVGKFFRANRDLCRNHQLEVGDLKTYAQLWACTFIFLVELDTTRPSDNEKLLYRHVAQRFCGLRQNLFSQGRSTLPSLDEAFIGTHGRPYDWQNFEGWGSTEERVPTDILYVRRHCKLDLSSPSARRKSATKLLKEELGRLGHDRMVEVLKEAESNDRIEGEARAEAVRQLRLHNQECEVCAPLPVEEDHQVGGADAGGAAEQV